ncbi:MAG: universal stress protein [Caldilineaceae bacterium]
MAATYAKILVPLDGSKLAALALTPARALAEQFGAELILFRVAPNVQQNIEFTVERKFKDWSGQQQARMVDEAGEALELLKEDLKIHGIEAHGVMGVGDPAEKIVDYVVDNDVDLVVMSTHGRTGLARWTYGSVARKVLDAAPCSIFLVRNAADTD